MATKAEYQRGYKQEREARKHAEHALKDKDSEIAELKAHLEAKLQGEQSISNNLGTQVIALEKALLEKETENEALKKKVTALSEALERIQNKQNKNSQNSSKPPSTNDMYHTPRNSREKSERPTGGQLWHVGMNLAHEAHPDHIVNQCPKSQCACGGSITLHDTYKSKQIIDIQIQKVITEERVHTGVCQCCKKLYSGTFSTNSKAHIQYGSALRSFIGMLSLEGFIPYKRLQGILKELTQGTLTISQGTIRNILKEIGAGASAYVDEWKTDVQTAPVLYADETPIKYNGDLQWLHTVSTEDVTILEAFEQHGFDAVTAMCILPGYTGILMSDHFGMYNKLIEATPARCNAHILRELQGLIEIHKKRTVISEFQSYLKQLHQWVKAKRMCVTAAQEEDVQVFRTMYHQLLQTWKATHASDFHMWQQKHPKQSVTHNPFNKERLLIERLLKYETAHLRFLTNFEVRFDNNIAERSLRLTKSKVKVSGSFRGVEAMHEFFASRSFIQTMKKKEEHLVPLIQNMFYPIIEV